MKPATLTENDALLLMVAKYKAIPTKEARARVLAWVKEAANMHPTPHIRQSNAKLHPLLCEAERQLATRGERPEMPTREEVAALFSWLGNGVAVLVLKVGAALCVVYLMWAAAVGMGAGIEAFFVANKWIFGGAIACGALAVLISGLELGEGQGGGEQVTHETFEQTKYFEHTKWEKTTFNN